MNKKEIWKSTLDLIQIKLDSPADFKTWFSNSKLSKFSNGEVEVLCKNNFNAEWLKQNYSEIIKLSLEKTAETNVNIINFVVDKDTNTESELKEELTGPIFDIINQKQDEERSIDQKIRNAGLNLKYSFDSYVVGSSNRLAHAAALAITDNPGTTYNPLYIYGGVGLGKTHIMQAVGISIIKKNPKANIYYCSCETFLNELVNSIRSGKTKEFRSKYRELDMLIIDDIQFISNKIETQTELFHTFNELYQSNKQIIFASDRPPTEIQNLEDRLRSRFQGGMVADINEPDYEMRIAILQKKCEEKGFNIPKSTIEIIAKLVESNIRELEGSLLKVIAFAGINDGILLEKEIAKILGKDAQTKRNKVKPNDIISVVCENFEINVRDIRGKRRTKNIALARQFAMYLLRKELDLPLQKVAQSLNRSDHTTALNAIDKVEQIINEEEDMQLKVQSIKKDLGI